MAGRNAAYWVLDVAFCEDHCRLRRDNGARDFATLRRIALSLLKQDKSSKLGLKHKRLKTTWDHNYFLHLLSIMINCAAIARFPLKVPGP